MYVITNKDTGSVFETGKLVIVKSTGERWMFFERDKNHTWPNSTWSVSVQKLWNERGGFSWGDWLWRVPDSDVLLQTPKQEAHRGRDRSPEDEKASLWEYSTNPDGSIPSSCHTEIQQFFLFSIICQPQHHFTSEHTPRYQIFCLKQHKKICFPLAAKNKTQTGSLYPALSKNLPLEYKMC